MNDEHRSYSYDGVKLESERKSKGHISPKPASVMSLSILKNLYGYVMLENLDILSCMVKDFQWSGRQLYGQEDLELAQQRVDGDRKHPVL